MICSVHSTNNGAIVEDNTGAPEPEQPAMLMARALLIPPLFFSVLFCWMLPIASPASPFLLIILQSQGFLGILLGLSLGLLFYFRLLSSALTFTA